MSGVSSAKRAQGGEAGRGWRALRRHVLAAEPLWMSRLRVKRDAIAIAPAEIGAVDPLLGEELLAGRFALAGTVVDAGGQDVFALPPPSLAWSEALHGFGWLRHLVGERNEATQAAGRRLIDQWINHHGDGRGSTWRADLICRRLQAWLAAAPAVLTGAESAFFERFVLSIQLQTRRLERLLPALEPGLPRLQAVITLAMVGLSLAEQRRLVRRASQALRGELARQIGADGAHVGRNPSSVLELLVLLLPLQMLYVRRSEAMPPELAPTIEHMLAHVRMMRHADGAIATFNGAAAVPQELLAGVLAHGEERQEPAPLTQSGGYWRMEAGQAVLIADCATTPPLYSGEAHAGTLSFEFSAHRQRLLVNCGAPLIQRDKWQTVMRQSAAHNTLILDNRPSSTIGRRAGARLGAGPERLTAEGDQTPEAIRLFLSHDGYARTAQGVHRRMLTLAHDGRRLSGQDTLVTTRAGLPLDLRFHLHPLVQLFTAPGVDGLILSPPEGPEWQFTADQPFDVHETVIVSGAEGPRRSAQIVISGVTTDAGWQAHWRFDQIGTAG